MVSGLRRRVPVVDRLGALFGAAGHELYLVGGSVRDAVLHELGEDLDFTTPASPDEIEALLRGVSRQVWTVGKKFGTIGARLPREPAVEGAGEGTDDSADWVVEITTYRADSYQPDSRKPEVRFGDSLVGDLVRRDFTVNAMAVDVVGPPNADSFIDPFGGLADLTLSRLRTPGTAEQSFSDDPLRMLRAARFAARLQFAPTPDVVESMTRMAGRLSIVSAERIRDEFSKLLLTDQPRVGLDLLVRTGLADVFVPELGALRLERDEHHRHKDVYAHSLTVLDQAISLERQRGHRPDLVNRLAALLHDIGKPKTRKFEPGGKVSFHHHDVVGAKLVRKRLTALRYPSEVVEAVAELVALHLRFHGYGDPSGAGPEWTDSAVRRYVRDAGDQVERLHLLTRADCTTRNQAKALRLRRAYDELEQRIAVLAEAEELDAKRPDLDGNQIMTILDIPPGRQVGQAYRHLLELRIEQGPLGVDRATEALRAWWAEQPR